MSESISKKRYSFRLTEKDKNLHDFLENLPSSKRSETVRDLLSRAIGQSDAYLELQKQYQLLEKELIAIKNEQQTMFVELKKLIETRMIVSSESIPMADLQEQKEIEEDVLSEEMANNGLNMMMGFGMDIDMD